MFAVGWGLQRVVLNRTLGKDILPPLLVTFGLSVALQNAMLEGFSADSQRIGAGALETRRSLGPVTVGVMPLLTFASAIAVIVTLNRHLLPHRAWPRLPGGVGRSGDGQPDGAEPGRVFAIATGLAMVVVTIAALYLGMRANFDPSIGPRG
jgi:branched-chain amino acid transport system permease protein